MVPTGSVAAVELDPAQREAVTCDDQPLAVIAAAGSGKTAVLTERIARRVDDESADERHVLAVTFSRQAASELTRRLAALDVRGANVGTFHGIAFGVLRQRWTDLGRPAPSLTTNREGLLGEALRTIDLGGRRRPQLNEANTELDWSRARLFSAEDYAAKVRQHGRRTKTAPDALAEVFAQYRTLKQRRRVIDFDDLLEQLLEETRCDEAFATQLRWRFRHFFVDEFQDINPLQHAVLETWRGGRSDLCVVGDPRQAIYGWNGAEPGLLADVEQTYPGIRVIRLQRNFRCSPAIVDAAATVLVASTTVDDTLAARPPSGSIALAGVSDERAEAELVAARLRQLHLPGRSWGSMAVLARTNGQLEPIAAALDAARIPNVLTARPPALADDPARRALLLAARAQSTAELLSGWARDLDDGIERVADSRLHRRLAGAVRRYLTSFPDGTGAAFLDWFELTEGADERRRTSHQVELLTFHAAKGREWRTVAVVGVEAGLVPHSTASTAEAAAEEARLLYVALTRASDELLVTWAATRNGRPAGRSVLLDRFVERSETPDELPWKPLSPTKSTAPSAQDPVLVELRAWRARAARAVALPEPAICADEVLAAIAAELPQSIEQLAAIPGVGPMAAARLGPRLLAVLAGLG